MANENLKKIVKETEELAKQAAEIKKRLAEAVAEGERHQANVRYVNGEHKEKED